MIHRYPFDIWMDLLDRLCYKIYGASVSDFPDMNYREMYDMNYTPKDALNDLHDMLQSEYGIDC